MVGREVLGLALKVGCDMSVMIPGFFYFWINGDGVLGC